MNVQEANQINSLIQVEIDRITKWDENWTNYTPEMIRVKLQSVKFNLTQIENTVMNMATEPQI